MKYSQRSLILLKRGEKLFSPVSNLSNHSLQQLSQAIAQLSYRYFRRFLEITPSKRSQNRRDLLGNFISSIL